MTLTIEKVRNGYIVRDNPMMLGEKMPAVYVFANIESALSFIRKEFGEGE